MWGTCETACQGLLRSSVVGTKSNVEGIVSHNSKKNPMKN